MQLVQQVLKLYFSSSTNNSSNFSSKYTNIDFGIISNFKNTNQYTQLQAIHIKPIRVQIHRIYHLYNHHKKPKIVRSKYIIKVNIISN